jgi:preprotein translocase subunit SecG
MIYGILIALQIIISILLVVTILLQSSKGGGLAGVAGGMMSSTVFGGRGAANFLSKATAILAAVFMINCVGMAVLSGTVTSKASVTQQQNAQHPQANPVPTGDDGSAAVPTDAGAATATPTQGK